MNELPDSLPQDERRFDRLVDGELSREQYAELLRSLEHEPDGWRRCALAFLEAQALQRELSDLVGESASASPPESSRPAPSPPVTLLEHGGQRSRRWPALVAIAASFLIAFGLGVMFRGAWPGHGAGVEGVPVAEDEQPAPSNQPAGDGEAAQTPTPEIVPPVQPRGNVRLVVDRPDGSGREELEVPLYDWSPESARMFSERPIRVPPEIRRMLQRMGHEVRWRQQVVPLETEDGQRVLIPFRQLEITPVGAQRYQ